ncbi:MAG TPA: hypothetical protein VJ728_14795 [Candidatus Binataceae bacterium]|nr:hypothetical protein [Candidatus Binataceae bacterium]
MNLGNFSDPADWLSEAYDLLQRRRVSEALYAFNKAEGNGHPLSDCAAGRWMCWMLSGDFESAWCESDALERSGFSDPNRFWDGWPFDGKRILLRALHGYGDAVQFIRYAPMLRRRAIKLTVQCHPELMPLLRNVDGVDETVTWPDSPGWRTKWDQQIEIMELPRAFRTTLGSIPNRVPYISIEHELVERSRTRLAKTDKPKVGLLWASSQYDPSRSTDLKMWAPILRVAGFEFYSFQRGAERAQLEFTDANVNDTAVHSHQMVETAADLTNMELLISVDTFGAHLAGALNRPVWLLLPYTADWRWMLNRHDSPWYPSTRLFRQSRPGDWSSIIYEVAAELSRVVFF